MTDTNDSYPGERNSFIVPALFYDVVRAVLHDQVEAVISAWSESDFHSPKMRRSSAEEALQAYRSARHLPQAPIRWFADCGEARRYTYSRSKQQPRPAYLPGISIAEALDSAWFAGAMRPPARTSLNSIR